MKTSLTQYVILGRADNQQRSPWKRAPMTPEQVQEAKGMESDEQQAYWEGFFSGANDAIRQHAHAHAHAQ